MRTTFVITILYLHMSHCEIRVFQDRMIQWLDAKQRCEAMGYHLATIDTPGKLTDTYGILKSYGPNVIAFIGYWTLNRSTENLWRWADGSEGSWAYWDGTGLTPGQDNTIAIATLSFKEPEYEILVFKDRVVDYSTDTYVCDGSSIGAAQWKLLGEFSFNRDAVKMTCAAVGFTLPSLTDSNQHFSLVSYLATRFARENGNPSLLWLDYFRDSGPTDTWQHEESPQSNFSMWDSGQPVDTEQNDCIGAQMNKQNNFKWVSVPCETAADHTAIVCQVPSSPAGYRHIQDATEVSWVGAYKSCERMNMQLLIIKDLSEFTDISVLFTVLNAPQVFIGAASQNGANKDSWIWVNGSPMNLDQWKENEPSHTGIACASFVLSQGRWRLQSGDCLDEDMTTDFICQPRDPDYGLTWIEQPTKLSWNGAKRVCQSRGQHLVTVGDAQKNAYIHLKLLIFFREDLYIGLSTDSQSAHWQWASGRNVSWSNWEEGYPEANTLKCAVFLVASGLWRTQNCGDEDASQFVCETPQNEPEVTADSLQLDSVVYDGGCPDGVSVPSLLVNNGTCADLHEKGNFRVDLAFTLATSVIDSFTVRIEGTNLRCGEPYITGFIPVSCQESRSASGNLQCSDAQHYEACRISGGDTWCEMVCVTNSSISMVYVRSDMPKWASFKSQICQINLL